MYEYAQYMYVGTLKTEIHTHSYKHTKSDYMTHTHTEAETSEVTATTLHYKYMIMQRLK